MLGDGQDRTEPATAKRRGEARKRGQVAKSPDLASIVVLFGVMLALHSLGSVACRTVTDYFTETFAHLDDTRLSIPLAMQHGLQAFATLGRAVGPLVLTAMAIGILANVGQTGLLWATERLRLNFGRLNPLTGLSQFFSSAAAVNLIKSSYKILLIGYITFVTLHGSYPQLIMMTRLEVTQSVDLLVSIVYRMTMRIVGTMLVLSMLDYFYQRYATEKAIRMSKQETKEEIKQTEGNPLVKSRVRARQRQIARQRMIKEVPNADVVVTNPTHFAVALQYDAQKMGAPVVVAKGQDLLALKIREIAQTSDVPIVENPPLARALYKQVELGREIPADLYAAVAEVLAFVYQINAARRARSGLAF